MSYTIIAEIDHILLSLLRDNLVPETVSKRDSIRLCTPENKGDTVVGICLFDIRKSEEVLSGGMINVEAKRQAYPSLFINLYYRITVWQNSDVKFQASSEHRILGRILQILHDAPVIMEDNMDQSFKIKLEFLQLSTDEKTKLSGGGELLNKVCLYYKVYPAEIESARSRMVNRVSNVGYSVDQDEE